MIELIGERGPGMLFGLKVEEAQGKELYGRKKEGTIISGITSGDPNLAGGGKDWAVNTKTNKVGRKGTLARLAHRLVHTAQSSEPLSKALRGLLAFILKRCSFHHCLISLLF